MVEFLLIFLTTALLGAVGSLQLGLVNSEVICTALNSDKKISKGAKYVALGGACPEIIYSFLALLLSKFIMESNGIYDAAAIILTGILIILIAISFFRRGEAEISESKVCNIKSEMIKEKYFIRGISQPFLKGFSLGIINFQLLFFWFIVSVQMMMYFDFTNYVNKVSFVLATPVGALLTLSLFIYLAKRFKKAYPDFVNNRLIFRIAGACLILIAVFQIYQSVIHLI
jgi:threonine/homoserine/homoserine lactone efflux protein